MRIAALALLAGTALVLAGCTPADPAHTSTPRPSATAAFATDAEALAAAEKAYGEYLAVSDEVSADGGEGVERLGALVTKKRLTVERQGADLLQEKAVHTAGRTRFSSPQLESVDRALGGTRVTFYACWDATNVRVLDASGRDVTPAARASKQTLEIRMIALDGHLLVDSDETWSGQSLCS